LAVFLLYFTGNLEVWHVYVATVFNAAFTTFQWPAYSAVTTLLVPKKHLGRASGMVQVGDAISSLFSPAIAGFLYVLNGLQGVLFIDFITFAFAVGTLVFVRFPAPKKSEDNTNGEKSTIWEEAAFGWKYIRARKGLFGLLTYFAMLNFFGVMISPLIVPLLLEMTQADTMGLVFSIVGVGMLAGTLTMSAWGGPKRRIIGIIVPAFIQSLATLMMGLRPSLFLIGASGFIFMFFNPILNGSSQALWQSKVAPDIQGRVFAVRRMIAMAIQPIGLIIVGPLTDYVFTPLMLEGGALAGSVGRVIGVGSGRGIGLFFIVIGVLLTTVTVLAYFHPRIRNVQEELPDVVEDEPVVEKQMETAAA
jgi:MFS family permease